MSAIKLSERATTQSHAQDRSISIQSIAPGGGNSQARTGHRIAWTLLALSAVAFGAIGALGGPIGPIGSYGGSDSASVIDRNSPKRIATGPIVALSQAVSVSTPDDVDPRVRIIATYIARSYRIAHAAAEQLALASFAAAHRFNLDPLLVVAVIAIESRFNPIAESDMGAMGLMQIIPRFHLDKLADHGGLDAILDPRANIRVGTQILQEYIGRAGSIEAGLQWYNGAANDPARAYAEKVIAEYDRLARTVGRPRMTRMPRPSTAAATPAIMLG